MTQAAQLPPPSSGAGCLGKGCLTFVVLLLILSAALIGGSFWGLHYLRQKYSATEGVKLPTLDRTSTIAPTPVTEPTASPGETSNASATEYAEEVQARWDAFEDAADRGERARIELTADDINALIQNDREVRGKVFVAIENNIGRVRVSIPLENVFMMGGRYLNGEATVEASPDGDPFKARISNVVLANQPVPDDVLDRQIFGWSSVRTLITDWLNDEDISTFKIQNNRVIGETRGSR